MKKSVLISAVFGTFLMLTACKKGENDPFLSLMSRDARITGVWELSSANTNNKTIDTPSGGATTTDVTGTLYDGTLLTTSDSTDGTQNWTNNVSYTQEIEINKDGTYKSTTINDGDKVEQTGHWWWLSDKKKKTRIAFEDDFGSFEIDRLKNKEMILTQHEIQKDTDSNGDITEDIWSGMWTYSKKK